MEIEQSKKEIEPYSRETKIKIRTALFSLILKIAARNLYFTMGLSYELSTYANIDGILYILYQLRYKKKWTGYSHTCDEKLCEFVVGVKDGKLVFCSVSDFNDTWKPSTKKKYKEWMANIRDVLLLGNYSLPKERKKQQWR